MKLDFQGSSVPDFNAVSFVKNRCEICVRKEAEGWEDSIIAAFNHNSASLYRTTGWEIWRWLSGIFQLLIYVYGVIITVLGTVCLP